MNLSIQESTTDSLNRLTSIIDTINDRPPEELTAEFATLRKHFLNLRSGSSDLAAQMQENDQQSELALESCEDDLNDKYNEQESLRGQIRELESQMEKNDMNIAQSEAMIKTYTDRLKSLQAKIRALNERAEEMKKWWWVPGYGQYLAIRTLADNDIGVYQSTRDELIRFQQELRSGKQDVQRFEQLRKQLNNALAKHQREITALEGLKNTLQEQRVKYKHQIVLFNNLGLYYRLLADKLRNLAGDLSEMNELIELLNQDVSLSLAVDGQEEQMSLRDAVLRLSEFAATIPYKEKVLAVARRMARSVNGAGVTSRSVEPEVISSLPVLRLANRSFHFQQGNQMGAAPQVISLNENGAEVGRMTVEGIACLSDVQLGVGRDIGLFGTEGE